MNDATSTPDDPDRTDQDGRAAVATGEQAAVTPAGDSEATASTSPRPSPRPGAVPSTPADAVEPVVEDPRAGPDASASEQSATNGSPMSFDKRTSASLAAETPTAQMPVPAPPNGSHPTPPVDDVTRPVGHGELPIPAAGPVPGPGPAAAALPPWQRVPGRGAQVPAQAGPTTPARPAGGLLDDGPTAFLEAPSRGDDTAGQDGRSSEKGRSWGSVRAVRNRPPRQAALQLRRLDPWSVLKLTLVLALVLFLVWMVAVGVLYGVLGGMGVWDRLNGTYADLVSGEAPTGSPLISAGRVFALAAVVGAINSLLFAVAITVGAFVYNVSADLVGGIEVTLSERD